MVNEANSAESRRTGAAQPDATDTATQASAVMKQFSKTDHEIDPDAAGLPEPAVRNDQATKTADPNSRKPGHAVDRPGTLTPQAGSPMEKVPRDGGAPER